MARSGYQVREYRRKSWILSKIDRWIWSDAAGVDRNIQEWKSRYRGRTEEEVGNKELCHSAMRQEDGHEYVQVRDYEESRSEVDETNRGSSGRRK